MKHTGMLFLSRHRPYAGRAKCGVFQLQLQAFDRIGQHQTEMWQITWTGPAAQRFWEKHEAALKPGTALQVELEAARTHTLYTRPPSACVHARVISMELLRAPNLARQANSYSPHETPETHMPQLKEDAANAVLFDTHAGRISGSRTSNTYSNAGRETTTYVPDARMQAFRLPSRMGNQLHYPDGTVEETNHARHNPNT